MCFIVFYIIVVNLWIKQIKIICDVRNYINVNKGESRLQNWKYYIEEGKMQES